MTEWVLLLTLNIIGQPSELRDVSLSMMSGFTSKKTCEIAGQRLASRSVVLIGRAREDRGIPGNTAKSAPAINTECVEIAK